MKKTFELFSLSLIYLSLYLYDGDITILLQKRIPHHHQHPHHRSLELQKPEGGKKKERKKTDQKGRISISENRTVQNRPASDC